MWSIYLKPTVIVEGSEVIDMLAKFPQVAFADKLNYIFVETHPSANNPILASELVDENGDLLTGEALAEEIQYQVFLDGRTRPIHLEKQDASRFYNLSAWQMWIGQDGEIEDDEENRTENYAIAYETMFPDEPKIERIADRKQQRIDTRIATRVAMRKEYRRQVRVRERQEEI